MASPARNGDATESSSEMHMQESSAPDVEHTLHSRKTPKLPPPRASTPKHTNIGSPKRMSTGRPHTTGKGLRPENENDSPSKDFAKTQPPANRVLDFTGDGVKKSIETLSPFKPRNTLRRSMGPQAPRRDVFASPEPVTKSARKRSVSAQHEVTVAEEQTVDQTADRTIAPAADETEQPSELPQSIDDAPIMLDEDDDYTRAGDDGFTQAEEESGADLEQTRAEAVQSSPSGRKGGRPRKSIESAHDTIATMQSTSIAKSTPPSRKRSRESMESQHAEVEASTRQEQASVASASPVTKKARGRPSKEKVVVHHDEGDEAIDPQLVAHGDQYMADNLPIEGETVQPEKKSKGKKARPAAPKERDPNRSIRAATSPVRTQADSSRGSKSPTKRPASRGGSMGPVSNVNLRATTPFEDAGDRVSRYGRPVYKPLQYWANETRVWRNGEVEGIVRAEQVDKPAHANKKGKKRGRKPKKGGSKLDDIEEESDTESTLADEWEDEVGVIAGTVASWDPATQAGDSAQPVREDLAFASSSIITRDVAGSEFKYAKIMTLPFFGSGLVELPPEGFKRAKNSRKMQMCFFVHEGKVMVEIGAQGGAEVNQFAISKGGVWVVPRGEFACFLFSFSSALAFFVAQNILWKFWSHRTLV